MQLKSILTCPHCGIKKEEIMQSNACIYNYKCINCDEVLSPKKDDCCVFCSYGNKKCPPKQIEELDNEQ